MKSFMDDLESWGKWEDPGQAQAVPTPREILGLPGKGVFQSLDVPLLSGDLSFGSLMCADGFRSFAVATRMISLPRQNTKRGSQKLFQLERDEFLQHFADLLIQKG